MTRRLKILHVVHRLDLGGLERLVGGLVRLVDADQFESHILTLSEFGRLSEGLEAHATLHRVASVRHWSMLWPAGLIRAIRAIGPDVVHSHSGVWYKASRAARRAGVRRLVHTDHGRHFPDRWHARILDGLAARRTDVVVAVSEALRRQMAATLIPRPRAIRVIVNGVDTERYRPARVNGALRAELGMPAGAPIIGSIGRLDAIKAYDVMIDAFAALRASWTDAAGPQPVLVLIGDGPERDRLAGLIAARGLERAVHLTGWRRDVDRIYPAFDVFTLSSWSEGTSLGLLEAMSTGVCPIVTAVGGSPAVLGETLRHRLVPPGDPAGMATAWREALQQPDRRRADGAAARERVEQAFGLRAMVRQYERIYAGEG
jgi:glycosyltransferase involved in cell wall biosynthesis